MNYRHQISTLKNKEFSCFWPPSKCLILYHNKTITIKSNPKFSDPCFYISGRLWSVCMIAFKGQIVDEKWPMSENNNLTLILLQVLAGHRVIAGVWTWPIHKSNIYFTQFSLYFFSEMKINILIWKFFIISKQLKL